MLIDYFTSFITDFADDIVSGIIRYESNYTSRSIKIGWNEPEDPNGLIKKYLLEYRRSDNVSRFLPMFAEILIKNVFLKCLLFFRAKLLENAFVGRIL